MRNLFRLIRPDIRQLALGGLLGGLSLGAAVGLLSEGALSFLMKSKLKRTHSSIEALDEDFNEMMCSLKRLAIVLASVTMQSLWLMLVIAS
jgi:hypothetical protein